ncbi:MAG: hypothetical protein K6E13_10665 [Lachnospiraceae bacterium]|nr:hypothetical protein [Lachnospiraceae bacterium]
MKRFASVYNPARMIPAINEYGYKFTVVNTVFAYVAAMVMTFAMTYFLKVKPVGMIVCVTVAIIFLPAVITYSYRTMYEQRRFSDTCLYVEQLLYAYRNRGNIVDALEETERVLPERSAMKECVREAIEHILYDYSDESVTKNGLEIIEKSYDSSKIRTAHAFIMRMEQVGGDMSAGVAILQKDRAVWQKQIVLFQKKCMTSKRNTVIAMIITLCMCAFTPAIMQKSVQNIRIQENIVYQVSSVVLVILFLTIYVFLLKKMSFGMLEKKSTLSEEEAFRLHKRVTEGKDDIGKKLAVSKLKRNIIKDFPIWFIDVSIRLQTNNVRVAIINSYDEAPNSIKPALAELRDDLAFAPEEAWPYRKFMKDYEISEIGAAMGMLYSISSGGGFEEKVQLEEILNRNVEIGSAAEEIYYEDLLGGMYGIFLVPALAGAGKMLIDMTLVLFAFLNFA